MAEAIEAPQPEAKKSGGFLASIGKAIAEHVDLTGLAERLWNEKLWPWAQEKLDETIDKYTPVLVEKLMAMLPTVVAAAVKMAVEKAFEMIPDLPNIELPAVGEIAGDVINKVIDADPDIPGLSNIIDVTELFKTFRDGLPHL